MRRVRRKRGEIIGEVVAHIILAAGGTTMLVPLLWMISTSLKDMGSVFIFPPEWIPRPVYWDNYINIWEAAPFSLFMLNSVKITVLGVIGQLFSCSIAAFAFSRLRFPGRNVLFLVLLATIMIPYQVTMIPVFIIMRSLGWVNTHWPLIVPYFCGGAFGVFLLRQFFLTIPRELEDSARIDGCNPFQIYWRIFLPLGQPVLATLGIFTFIARWNDLIGPVIYLQSEEKMTITVGLCYIRGYFYTDVPLLMTGGLLSMIPILVIFVFAQKYFVRGIVLTGIKG